jgi:cell division septum initiation protein DivIVA
MSRAHEAMRRVYETLDELVALVETARAMPLSASCVVPREQVLDLLDDIQGALPQAFSDARELVAAREELLGQARDRRDRAVAQAQAQAADILAAAHAEAERLRVAALAEHEQLVADTEVRRAAEAESRGILEAARDGADRLRQDADSYVDGRLEVLSEVLSRTLGTVQRGREVLAERAAEPRQALSTTFERGRNGTPPPDQEPAAGTG